MRTYSLGPLGEGEAYGEGEEVGREQAIKDFEAIAVHWERETGGGYKQMREGARWLRTAIKKVRERQSYDGCMAQGPDPYEVIRGLRDLLRDGFYEDEDHRTHDLSYWTALVDTWLAD